MFRHLMHDIIAADGGRGNWLGREPARQNGNQDDYVVFTQTERAILASSNTTAAPFPLVCRLKGTRAADENTLERRHEKIAV